MLFNARAEMLVVQNLTLTDNLVGVLALPVCTLTPGDGRVCRADVIDTWVVMASAGCTTALEAPDACPASGMPPGSWQGSCGSRFGLIPYFLLLHHGEKPKFESPFPPYAVALGVL